MGERPDNPYDMNSSSFDADKYLQKLLKVSWNLDENEKSQFQNIFRLAT